VRTVTLGWAVAAWLGSHAAVFKLQLVRYQGYQWTRVDGRKGWRRAPRSAGATAARARSLGVAFG
jgi:hypothetical protein